MFLYTIGSSKMTRFSGLLLNTGLEKSNEEETELAKRDLENKLAQLDSQITMEEEEYKTMQNVHKQVQDFSFHLFCV